MKRPLPFGKYLLLERINVGGMAEIFIAKAFGVEGFERILAIKRILPTMAEDAEFISMFIDEARISVQLNHANIVHIHELGRYGDTYFIAMEYVPGRDLRAVLEYYQREQLIMPVAQAVYIASRMCDGLDHAHRKKDARGVDLHIVHRDVSPQNVLLSFDGEVKLIDFGIAKAAGRLQKTQAGILKGKFGYMSPEQVRGLEIDHRSDIFAVGVVLFEMLTGQRLFTGESDFSVLERVRDAVVPPPREFNEGIPEGLETILLRALSGEREDRYQWASDLQEDLMRFLLSGDAIYGAKHLSGFMNAAFADELVVEAQRMERYAAVDRADELDSSQATTNYGPRPDLEAASARPSLEDAPPSPAANAPQADHTMVTEPPASKVGSGELPRHRPPERGQVVIGQAAEKYDGATVVGVVPSLAAIREAAAAPKATAQDQGERTYVGELPAREAAAPDEGERTYVGEMPSGRLSPADNADRTYVGEAPSAAPLPAGAIPEDDDEEQDTRMLEAAEFAAQGFDASLPPADEEESDDLTDPAMRLAERLEPTWQDEAANASAAGWGLPDAPAAPKREEGAPSEAWDGSGAPEDDDGSNADAADEEDEDTGRDVQQAAAAASIAARAAQWGPDPVTRAAPLSDYEDEASSDPDDDAFGRSDDEAPEDDPYGDAEDEEPVDSYAADFGDGPGDDDDDGGATRLPQTYDTDDQEDEDPQTRLPAAHGQDGDDEEWEEEQTPVPAAAPARRPVAAVAKPKAGPARDAPGGLSKLQSAFQANPKPFFIGGAAVLGLLLIGLLVAIFSPGAPELVVYVDPASARVTVNGQPAQAGGVVANQTGVFLVRAEASGYLADEAEVTLTADSGRREITLRLGVAPPPSMEPPPEVPAVAAVPAEDPPDDAAGEEGPARAYFMGEVAGAEVRLDGALVGTLPEFETGALVGGRTYTYAVSREGYQPHTGEFTAVEGKVMEIEITLEPLAKPAVAEGPGGTTKPAIAPEPRSTTTKPAATTATKPAAKPAVATSRPRPARTKMGKLAASSKPSGAAIFVDGKKMNRVTPVGLGSPLQLPVGEHTIVFTLDGKSSAPRKITVKADGITKLANVPIP